MFRLDHDSRTISVQREIRINPRYKPVDYGMEYLGIRGDTIMWFYNDYDGESREHLILARLDDPDCSATRYLDLVGDGHILEGVHGLYDSTFPGDIQGFTF